MSSTHSWTVSTSSSSSGDKICGKAFFHVVHLLFFPLQFETIYDTQVFAVVMLTDILRIGRTLLAVDTF